MSEEIKQPNNQPQFIGDQVGLVPAALKTPKPDTADVEEKPGDEEAETSQASQPIDWYALYMAKKAECIEHWVNESRLSMQVSKLSLAVARLLKEPLDAEARSYAKEVLEELSVEEN